MTSDGLTSAESPRWYIKKHRYNDAFKSLRRLRNTPLQAARDLYYIHSQVRLEEIMLGDGDIRGIRVSEGEKITIRRGRYLTRFTQLFTIPRVRRATLAAFVVMIAQQMCGSKCSDHLPRTSVTMLTTNHSQYHGLLLIKLVR